MKYVVKLIKSVRSNSMHVKFDIPKEKGGGASCKKMPSVMGPRLWNDIPLVKCIDIKKFTKKLRNFFLKTFNWTFLVSRDL